MSAFEKVLTEIVKDRDEVVAACRETLAVLMDTSVIDQKRQKLEGQAAMISSEVKSLIDQQARGTVEGFSEKYAQLERRFNLVNERMVKVDAEKYDKLYRARQAEVFLKTLSADEMKVTDDLFIALVDRVIVGDGLKFVLRDGSEWAAE